METVTLKEKTGKIFAILAGVFFVLYWLTAPNMLGVEFFAYSVFSRFLPVVVSNVITNLIAYLFASWALFVAVLCFMGKKKLLLPIGIGLGLILSTIAVQPFGEGTYLFNHIASYFGTYDLYLIIRLVFVLILGVLTFAFFAVLFAFVFIETSPKLRAKLPWVKYLFFVPALLMLFVAVPDKIFYIVYRVWNMIEYGEFYGLRNFVSAFFWMLKPCTFLLAVALFFLCFWLVYHQFVKLRAEKKRLLAEKAEIIAQERARRAEAWRDAQEENEETIDFVEELKKYKELFDTGVIDEEEFKQMKRRLLYM